ncbi:MAG: glycosyltransferase family 87 protein [Chloroflexota bacterium]|nr:glycosyltransferase family 87 protein [Chloroflexota bacterium]
MSSNLLQVDDYVEYWAAGYLNMTGGNPFAPDELLPVQLEIGRHEGVPVMMWNPPFTLAIAMPLALLSYPSSRFLWFLLQMFVIALSASWLWHAFDGPPRNYWLAWLIAFTFYPTFALLQTGQIGGLLLLGVAGFLFFEGRRRPWVAGMFASLTAIKPHLLYLFWIALVLWTISHRRWRVLAGAATTLLGGLMIASIVNPPVILQYLHAATSYPPNDWATPTLGGFLRWVFGARYTVLQILPVSLGFAWLAVRWWHDGSQWRWIEQMPAVVLVSVLTAAYGWSSDKIVLLVILIPLAIWLVTNPPPRIAVLLISASYLMINLLALVRHGGNNDFEYVWFGPALLLWYLCVEWYRSRREKGQVKVKTV